MRKIAGFQALLTLGWKRVKIIELHNTITMSVLERIMRIKSLISVETDFLKELLRIKDRIGYRIQNIR